MAVNERSHVFYVNYSYFFYLFITSYALTNDMWNTDDAVYEQCFNSDIW